MKNLTPEMLEKAKAAKTVEELLALAKENNVEITEEEAQKFLSSSTEKLSDDELDNVAGGGCGDDTVYKYTFDDGYRCEDCGREWFLDWGAVEWGQFYNRKWKCYYCGKIIRRINADTRHQEKVES